jgi:hypothetical protein
MNCVSLAHLTTKEVFSFSLPPHLHCAELYLDCTYFEDVPSIENLEAGDLIWFGVDDPRIQPEEFEPVYDNGQLINWREFPVKHVGVHTGEFEDDDPLVLHATHIERTNAVWPLSRFADYSRYRKIYSVRRLKDDYKTQKRIIPGLCLGRNHWA